MLNRIHIQTGNRPRRAGLSLVELLVVLLVVGILVALIAGPLGNLLGSSKEAATKAVIKQIDGVIQARYQAVLNADLSVEAKKLAALNSGVSQEEAEFLLRKALYRQALPQRPEDLFGLDMNRTTANDNAPYHAAYNNAGGETASDNTAITAAEVFTFALLNGSSVRALPGGKSYPVPLLELDSISSEFITDIDGDGIRELVDAWGFPFRFYNFPTRLIRESDGTLNSANARILAAGLSTDTSGSGPLARDPMDPTGLLRNQFSSSSNLTYAPSTTLSRAAFNETNYHTPATHFFPLLVSAGPDSISFGPEALGLGEPTSTTSSSGAFERLGMIIDQDTGTAGVQITSPTTGETPIGDNITNQQE